MDDSSVRGPIAHERAAGALEGPTAWWWSALCASSVVNVVLWALAYRADVPSTAYRTSQLTLSAIFVLVCAFRSFFPRVDLERLCLWDTPLSAIFVGRSAATAAELCFAAQCALFVERVGELTGLADLSVLAALILPLIVVAQLACWYAVLTLNHLGHALEEVLWTLKVGILAVAFGGAWLHTSSLLQVVMATAVVCCVAAAVLMCWIDVPMYFARWRQGRAQGVQYLSLWAGVKDTLVRRRPSRAWSDWRGEVPWMTSYFSLAVWMSIAMTLLESIPGA